MGFKNLFTRRLRHNGYCCSSMDYHANRWCEKPEISVPPGPEYLDLGYTRKHDKYQCADCVIYETEGKFGIPVHDGGTSYITIKFCPWCGRRLAGYGTRTERKWTFQLQDKEGNPLTDKVDAEAIGRQISQTIRNGGPYEFEDHDRSGMKSGPSADGYEWVDVGMGIDLPYEVDSYIEDGRRYARKDQLSSLKHRRERGEPADNNSGLTRLDLFGRQMRRER